MTPDQVVAGFELGSSLLITLSIVKLHKDKVVRGVSPWPILFFAIWGWWNVYWYSFIDAPWAWWAGLGVVASNTTWIVQMFYYIWKEKKQGVAQPGRASGLEPEGRRIEACHPDQP